MKLRLDPSDEYMHPLEDASNFNESMYFNFYDAQEKIGGFLRLGNRANESYAEMTTCLYLPDGRVAFTYHRPEITNNDAFAAGGMRFDVIEPFQSLRATYHGKICVLERPLDMADPRTAFTQNPWVDCSVELDYRGLSPMLGGEPVNEDGSPIEEKAEQGFARGHYEQHVGGRGTVRVGDEEWIVNGVGLRDHSWGPRFWQSPFWYRWLTGNFDEDSGFVLSITASRDGGRKIFGVWFANGAYEVLSDIKIETEWSDGDFYHQKIHASARAGDIVHEIEGKVMALIPLRNRRTTPEGEQLITRISEGMTQWSSDGRIGSGLSEYLDQIIDGVPVGISG